MRSRLALLWRVVLEHPRQIVLVWAAAFFGFLLLPFGVLSLRAGALPAYLKGFDLRGWAVDMLTLAMPLGERLHYISEQPLLEAGVQDSTGAVQLYYVLVVHNIVTFTVLSALTAIYVALLRVYLSRRRQCTTLGAQAATYGGLGAVSVAGVSGTTLSAAACCGGPIAPAVLAFLGFGAGVAEVVSANYREVAEVAGLLVMAGSIVYLTGRIDAVDRTREDTS